MSQVQHTVSMPQRQKRSKHQNADPGDILWLRQRPAGEASSLVATSAGEDIFNHPVMLWSLDVSDGQACVLIVCPI